jgi:hypothetical protein
MRDTATSFVRKVVGSPLEEPPAEPQWRKAFTAEREGASQAFSISVRLADGREAEGFAMSMYIRHKWLDRDPRCERLMLKFSDGVIVIEGQHLQRGLDALEEGKLRTVTRSPPSRGTTRILVKPKRRNPLSRGFWCHQALKNHSKAMRAWLPSSSS